MSQSLSSEVSDLCPEHLESRESADPLLGMVKLMLSRVILQNTCLKRHWRHKDIEGLCHETGGGGGKVVSSEDSLEVQLGFFH